MSKAVQINIQTEVKHPGNGFAMQTIALSSLKRTKLIRKCMIEHQCKQLLCQPKLCKFLRQKSVGPTKYIEIYKNKVNKTIYANK